MVGSETSLFAYTHDQKNKKKNRGAKAPLLHGEEYCDGNICACFFWKQTHIKKKGGLFKLPPLVQDLGT